MDAPHKGRLRGGANISGQVITRVSTVFTESLWTQSGKTLIYPPHRFPPVRLDLVFARHISMLGVMSESLLKEFA